MTDINAAGYAIHLEGFSQADVHDLLGAVSPLVEAERGGARNLFAVPEVKAAAAHPAVRRAAESALGSGCFAVRALLFDKTPSANWRVTWHQDVTIAVLAPHDVPGYGPWSTKAGIAHVQPPVGVLAQMVAVRVHLDPCGPDNGPVRVLPGTHRLGKLSPASIDSLRVSVPEVECLLPAGGLLAMRPLLLHASSPARIPAHRRVLHLEFAAAELQAPLEWYDRVSDVLSAT